MTGRVNIDGLISVFLSSCLNNPTFRDFALPFRVANRLTSPATNRKDDDCTGSRPNPFDWITCQHIPSMNGVLSFLLL